MPSYSNLSLKRINYSGTGSFNSIAQAHLDPEDISISGINLTRENHWYHYLENNNVFEWDGDGSFGFANYNTLTGYSDAEIIDINIISDRLYVLLTETEIATRNRITRIRYIDTPSHLSGIHFPIPITGGTWTTLSIPDNVTKNSYSSFCWSNTHLYLIAGDMAYAFLFPPFLQGSITLQRDSSKDIELIDNDSTGSWIVDDYLYTIKTRTTRTSSFGGTDYIRTNNINAYNLTYRHHTLEESSRPTDRLIFDVNSSNRIIGISQVWHLGSGIFGNFVDIPDTSYRASDFPNVPEDYFTSKVQYIESFHPFLDYLAILYTASGSHRFREYFHHNIRYLQITPTPPIREVLQIRDFSSVDIDLRTNLRLKTDDDLEIRGFMIPEGIEINVELDINSDLQIRNYQKEIIIDNENIELTRYELSKTVLDIKGNVVAGAEVSITYLSETKQLPAIVYTEIDSTESINTTPQIITDKNGWFRVWLDSDDYMNTQEFNISITTPSNSAYTKKFKGKSYSYTEEDIPVFPLEEENYETFNGLVPSVMDNSGYTQTLFNNYYHEFTYNDKNQVMTIEFWNNSSKDIYIGIITNTWEGNNLTKQVLEFDELVQTINYEYNNDKLISVNSEIS